MMSTDLNFITVECILPCLEGTHQDVSVHWRLQSHGPWKLANSETHLRSC